MGKRNATLDFLKLILAIFVVGIHSGFFSDLNKSISFLMVNGIFRIAVPTFFIINGFYFTRVIHEKAILQWVKRIIILYAIWMIIYRSFWFDPSNLSQTLLTVLVGSNHLWYINALIFCGLVLYGARNWPLKSLMVIGFILFVIGVFIQYAANFHVFTNPKTDAWLNTIYIYRNFLFFGLPFFISGYAIERDALYQKIPQNTMVTLLCVGVALLLAESYLMMHFTNEGADILLSLLLLCPATFVYCFNAKLSTNFNTNNVAIISTAIYLVHIHVMDMAERWFELSATNLFVVTIIASTSISLVVMQITKYLKVLLGQLKLTQNNFLYKKQE